MPQRRHGNPSHRNPRFGAMKDIREQEMTRTGQTSAQERLQRQTEARQRKLERQKEKETTGEPTLPAVETHQSAITRLWESLRSIRGGGKEAPR